MLYVFSFQVRCKHELKWCYLLEKISRKAYMKTYYRTMIIEHNCCWFGLWRAVKTSEKNFLLKHFAWSKSWREKTKKQFSRKIIWHTLVYGESKSSLRINYKTHGALKMKNQRNNFRVPVNPGFYSTKGASKKYTMIGCSLILFLMVDVSSGRKTSLLYKWLKVDILRIIYTRQK